MLSLQGIKLIIYEPLLKEDNFNGIKIEKDISFFKKNTDLILANRLDKNLDDVLKKVYTRDIFKKD